MAIKKIHLVARSTQRRQQMKQFAHELTMLARLSHPNILRLSGYVNTSNTLYLITELAVRGNLRHLLRAQLLAKGSERPEGRALLSAREWMPEVLSMTLDIARGIEYLQSRTPPILHRDLKSDNVLVFDSGLKICDFGMAKIVASAQHQTMSTGTVQWCAPEVLAGNPFTLQSDIWSMGIIFWELLTLQEPHVDLTPTEIIRMMTASDTHTESFIQSFASDLPADVPSWYLGILQGCLTFLPDRRWNIQKVLTMCNLNNKS